MSEGIDDADIAKLTNLNDYVDKIRFEYRQNLILNQEHKVKVNNKPFLSNHDLLKKVEIVSKFLWVSIAQPCDTLFSILYFSTPPFSTFNSHNIKSTISDLADILEQEPKPLTLAQTSNPLSGSNKNQFPNESHPLVQNYRLTLGHSIHSTAVDSIQFSHKNDFIAIYQQSRQQKNAFR